MTEEKKSKKRPCKGEYGYIDYTKRNALIFSVISVASVFVIFFTGVILYHTNKSLFSIIAAVASLPAAKLATGYIVRIPYKTGEYDLYNILKNKQASNSEYEGIIGADFIISSREKSMELTFAYIVNGKAVCYTANPKTDAKELEKYLKTIFTSEEIKFSQLRVYNDADKFIKNIDDICKEIGKEYTDKRIFEKLCAYSM